MKPWSFIQCSDLHLGYDPDGIWNNRVLTTKSFDIFQCFLNDVPAYSPDFIVITGDICSCENDFVPKKIKNLFNSLGIPLYLLGGNHDLSNHQIRERELKYFDTELPEAKFTYAFTHKNLRFCMLEVSWMWKDSSVHAIPDPEHHINMKESHKGFRWVLSKEHLQWLENELKEHGNYPVVVSIHTPLFPIPERGKFKGYRDSGILSNAEKVLDLLYKHPRPCIVLSGHMHMNYVVRSKSVVQITTSALCEYPIEFRKFLVHTQKIEIHTFGLSNTNFAQQSLIPGREIVQGAPEDRTLTINLE